MDVLLRPDGRAVDELRPIKVESGIAPHASGSAIIEFGNTKVICTACLEKKVPGWMEKQNIKGGWITAEYSMLPYSTLTRKPRDISRGKADGRTVEIQRLIGRSMRAVVDLSKLPGYTLWIDCDVLQADGGTRTASISGAYIAAGIAVQKLIKEGKIAESPFRDSVAAISVGMYKDTAILDLNYLEDKDASVDSNIVMTGNGRFVEIQGSGEEATFSGDDFNNLVTLAKKGIQEISALQKEAIDAASS